MDKPPSRRSGRTHACLTLQFDDFAYRTIQEESLKLGVSVEEFAIFGVLYYLADLDSGRVARSILRADG